MSSKRSPQGPMVIAAAGVLVLIAGVGRLVWVWVMQDAAAADPMASVLGVVLAAAGVAAALLGWTVRRSRVAAQPVTAEQLQQAMDSLSVMVSEQWALEARARALGDPEPMPVRWRLTSRALMDHPSVIAPETTLRFEGSSARIGSLTAAFRSLPRRRLVIVGGPGTGKTTLAVQLLCELLAHLEPEDPVPVLFSLTSWAPESQPRVQEWLASQLEETYPALRAISADAAGALAAAPNKILPILDGLDEVSPARRAGIIAALNTSLTGGVVLTSRRPEYRTAINDAGDVLTAAATISPLAFTATEISTYLEESLPPNRPPAWDYVLTKLRTGTAGDLAAVTATPLGLWLVRTVYIDGPTGCRPDPVQLVDLTYPTPESLTSHLLEELIPAVIRTRLPIDRRRRNSPEAPLRPAHHYGPDEIRRWLTTLAEQLRHTNSRDWRWWLMASLSLPTAHARLRARVAPLLLIGPLSGVALLPLGPEVSLGLWLLVGLLILVMTVPLHGKPPSHANFRLAGRWHEVPFVLAFGLGSGLTFGVLVGLTVGVATDLTTGVTTGLASGLLSGLASMLETFWDSSDLAESSTSPTISFTGDIARSMIKGTTGGLTSGFFGGLLVGLVLPGLEFMDPSVATLGLSGVLASGLVIGLVAGLGYSLRNPWFGFVIAGTWYFLRRPARLPTPWRVMQVLQDCSQLGLLRTVGPVYQFRHAQLQDHLAPPIGAQTTPGPAAATTS